MGFLDQMMAALSSYGQHPNAPTDPTTNQPDTGYVQGGPTITDPFNRAVVQNNLAAGFQQAAMGGQSSINNYMGGLAGLPYQLPQASAGTGATQPGQAPTYDISGLGAGGAGMDPALKNTMSAGNAGAMQQGLAAFIGGPYEGGGQAGGNGAYIAGYNLNPTYNDRTRSFADRLAGAPVTNQIADNSDNNKQLQNYLNNNLSNYYSVSGLSSGWDGSSGDPRSAATTLYQNTGGQLVPVSDSYRYSAPTSGSINREQNMQTLTALSMMAPVFGGAAGVLGAGAEGTLSAGSGLGLTNAAAGAIGSGATNALVNAGVNYALSGGQGGIGSIGSSLLGSGLSAAGNSLMGNSGGLGSMFDTSNAAGIGSTYNPMTGFNQALGSAGINGNLGNAANFMSALGGGGITGSTAGQAAAGLAGNYLARQIDPRLAGFGSQAGRGLANLYYR